MLGNQFEELRVLVLDDSQTIRTLLRSILLSNGVRHTFEAGDAEMAFRACKGNDFDLAFVDLHLPFIDGMEFAHMIRQARDSPNKKLPLILMVEGAGLGVVKQSINAGFDWMLAKPFSTSAVMSKVWQCLSNPLHYIETSTYFGPCRRRGMNPSYDGPMRRSDDPGYTKKSDEAIIDYLDLGDLSAVASK